MASIFTFDPDPPRVASPWLDEIAKANGKVSRLAAEPQEGPTEYKLHLLLRPRRSFIQLSTGNRMGGPSRTALSSSAGTPRSMSEVDLEHPVQLHTSPLILRQGRLQQLTTQLLWRLQQSSTNHATSYSSAVIPGLLNAATKNGDSNPQQLIPGLQDSQGALYEIGVADDGRFIGLAEDEMNESITNLRIMAASLGCSVSVLRMVSVGSCEWLDEEGTLQKDSLWVAEASVKPDFGGERNGSVDGGASVDNDIYRASPRVKALLDEPSATEQLRVTLTGATMSGKSSLLGSLTTATLDNGRGKSRLSLLKHRHEILSGMTSSITQELIGYTAIASSSANDQQDIKIINYASGNISSWVDLHALSRSGRLCLLSDSAGHLRYRRSTMRGLIGWAPHWTLLCVPADNFEDTSGMTGSTPPPQEVLGVPSVDVDLSEANLDLCLRLQLPLVIAVTKLDIVSRVGLRSCLSKLLTVLKAAGRKPLLIPDTSNSETSTSSIIDGKDISSMQALLAPLNEDPLSVVPIIMTSVVKGSGISRLHAMLQSLPIPPVPVVETATDQAPIFHIEDVYPSVGLSSGHAKAVTVMSGHVKHGSINIGDELSLGPFAADAGVATPEPSLESTSDTPRPPVTTSRSFPGALPHIALLKSPTNRIAEWQRVKVVSLRNLRLPVHSLLADQVGTVGVVLLADDEDNPMDLTARCRKGMVLSGNDAPTACSTLEAAFSRKDVDSLSIRSSVVIYTNSVRASARILAGTVIDHPRELEEDIFGNGSTTLSYDEHEYGESESQSAGQEIAITLQFLASREYIEPGSQIMIMPGGGPGLFGGAERGEKGMASLEGFVGRVLS